VTSAKAFARPNEFTGGMTQSGKYPFVISSVTDTVLGVPGIVTTSYSFYVARAVGLFCSSRWAEKRFEG
jgi:hypothetical protein